jgi:hypothetical protein
LADFQDNFEDVWDIIIVVTVIDDDFNQFLSIVLKIQLLKEVTTKIYALFYVRA